MKQIEKQVEQLNEEIKENKRLNKLLSTKEVVDLNQIIVDNGLDINFKDIELNSKLQAKQEDLKLFNQTLWVKNLKLDI